jgi:hypothetical protein
VSSSDSVCGSKAMRALTMAPAAAAFCTSVPWRIPMRSSDSEMVPAVPRGASRRFG